MRGKLLLLILLNLFALLATTGCTEHNFGTPPYILNESRTITIQDGCFLHTDNISTFSNFIPDHYQWIPWPCTTSWNDSVAPGGYPLLRLKFEVPTNLSPDQSYGIFFPMSNGGMQVYLNGEHIYETRPFTQAGTTDRIHSRHQVIPFPDNILKEGQNDLIIRGSTLDGLGGFQHVLYMGPMPQVEDHMVMLMIHYSSLFAVSFFIGLFYLIFFINRTGETYYLYFSLLSLSLGSFLFSSMGISYYFFDNYTIWMFFIFFGQFINVFLMRFFLNFFKLKMGLPGKGIEISVVLTALSLLIEIVTTNGMYMFYKYGLNIQALLMLVTFAYLISRGISVIRNNAPYAIRMNIGLYTIIAGFAWSLLFFLRIAPVPVLMFDGFVAMIIVFATALASRFSDLHRDLEYANERLLSVDRIKDEFLANTSHELRTPLNGIIGIADSLMDGAAGVLNDVVIRNLNVISSSGKRLSSLVNDILDFQKLKNRDIMLNPVSVDLHEMVDVVFAVSSSLIGNKNLKLINNIPDNLPAALGDENRMQQIFYNLIGNAIKFTESGTIVASAILSDNQSGLIEVSISDTGIGISEDKHERIFESFEQADTSTRRDFGGAGLGLSITKRLVELHGGSIRLSSKLYEGSTFYFTIPSSSEKPNPIKKDSFISSYHNYTNGIPYEFDPRQKIVEVDERVNEDFSILVVDDEPINRLVLSNILGVRNYHVFETDNGPDALHIIDSRSPDLVLLDIMMPRMNGYEVCRQVRKKYDLSELPIIMLTAKNQIGDLIEGLKVGANDYLPKPFSREELISRIQTHLNLHKINKTVSRFVPQDFLRQLDKKSITEVHLGDQVQKEMTVLFSDIRDFTSISERMSPHENFEFLNSYLEAMGPIIRSNQGFIDKYIGDAIMALFPSSGGAEAGLRAAIEMQKSLQKLNRNRDPRISEIKMGIGVHVGPLMLGIIGEKERTDGTVIADAVNLCSRLEGLTKIYGASILVTESIFTKLPNPENYMFRMLGEIKVKGKEETVSIFEIFDGESEHAIELKMKTREEFEHGLLSYIGGNFETAGQHFESVLAENPDDMAASLYHKRCDYIMKEKELPIDWKSSLFFLDH